ncbi:MAG: carbohydrate kinase [Planctomycetales bacterium]|nr:carbohydrate kinase [Planctomycetales bacterium]
MITRQRLEELLAAFPGERIGLLGDLFLDRYLQIAPELYETSIETYIEAFQIAEIRNSPGALGTIMNNLTALGVGTLVPVTVIGDDGHAYDLLQALSAMPVDSTHVIQSSARNTPTYTKPMTRNAAGRPVELNRLDIRNRTPMPADLEAAVIARLGRVFAECDGLIVLDQVNEEGVGVVTPAVREQLAVLAEANPQKLVFVDSRAHIDRFRRGVLKPNLAECLKAMGRPLPAEAESATEEALAAGRAAAVELAQRHGETLFCTMGERGMLVVTPAEGAQEIAGFPVSGPIDFVGAGDSATSGIVSSLVAGASLAEAATVGNLVASITVQQIGTTGTATPQQVLDRHAETH